MVSSHGNVHKEAIPVETFEGVQIEPGGVIGIDEGQFIKGICDFAERAANLGCTVIIAALNYDYQRRPFENIRYLKAEEVVTFHAICFDCKKEASFTKRISNETDVEIIGGSEQYKAVCRICYFK